LRAAAGAVIPASDVALYPGRGLEGIVDGTRWRIGAPEFARGNGAADPVTTAAVASLPADGTAVVLANEHAAIAVFGCADALRPGAREVVTCLHADGIGTLVLSGDRATAARSSARAVGIDDVRAPLAPVDKCGEIAALQRDGRCVAMIGDGVNDAAALAHADVAITFGSATPLAQCTSDVVLLGERLADVPLALRHARKVRRIIAQNLAWAMAYNAIALPAAAAGLVTPLVASIGMSVSSLIVVLNAARAARIDRRRPDAGLAKLPRELQPA
jgi:Cu2+-exporting ATPase